MSTATTNLTNDNVANGTLTATTATSATSASSTRRPIWQAAVLASIAAAAVNGIIAAIAHNADVPLRVKAGEPSIPTLGFIQVTFVCGLLGLGLAALCRRSKQPTKLLLTIAIALTAVSLVPPLLVDATTATRVVLEVTHLVAAAMIIPVLAARLRPNNARL